MFLNTTGLNMVMAASNYIHINTKQPMVKLQLFTEKWAKYSLFTYLETSEAVNNQSINRIMN